jgi:hypothetical protein
MIKDKFVRFRLLAIVLPLGIIACRVSPPEEVKAADAKDCLIEGSGDTTAPEVNSRSNKRAASGGEEMSFQLISTRLNRVASDQLADYPL